MAKVLTFDYLVQAHASAVRALEQRINVLGDAVGAAVLFGRTTAMFSLMTDLSAPDKLPDEIEALQAKAHQTYSRCINVSNASAAPASDLAPAQEVRPGA